MIFLHCIITHPIIILFQAKIDKQMSIYSGFATRQQEEAYDENIATLLYLLQKRVYKFYNNEPANDAKFIDLLMKVYATVKGMEDSKYLEPKLSPAMG